MSSGRACIGQWAAVKVRYMKKGCRRGLVVVVDESDGVVGDGVGVVVGFGLVFGVGERGDQGVVADEGRRIVVAAGAVDRAVVPVESAVQGQLYLGPSGRRTG